MCLIFEKTIDTPYIKLESGHIEIKGRSMPENVLKFYKPIKEWIENYINKPAEFTKIEFYLPYANSSSIKQINDFLKVLNVKYKQGADMKVFWTFEEGDENAEEIGNDLESLIEIPFEYIVTDVQKKQQRRLKVKNLKTGKIGEISQRYWETIIRNGHEKDFEVFE
ncbi:MAG TPA: DUF1987 domain-containing protein [Bacteroidales bacterium]|nr:DUF1987 domain-containing protein [Bacteroidales bacterium]